MLDPIDHTRHTAQIVAAFVAANALKPAEVAALIGQVGAVLGNLDGSSEPPAPAPPLAPAVSRGRSVQNDYIVCLEDGRRLKMLKRYLRTQYDLTPDQYRRKWDLAADYPMVAPAYAERRSDFAKANGLGKRTGIRRRG